MKALFTILLALSCVAVTAQKKRKVLYDTLGNETTYEMHFAPVVIGTHKSVLDKAANKRLLVPMSKEEFEAELKRTEKKMQQPKMFGKDMPDFELVDVSGNHISKQDLAGKVAVVNFWFIGCPPCEMERPALNILRHKYDGREDVVFLSIARDSPEAVRKFVKDQPIDYDLYPSSKEYIKDTFEINGYPVNIVVDKNGRYLYYGLGAGTGVINILQKQIDTALAVN